MANGDTSQFKNIICHQKPINIVRQLPLSNNEFNSEIKTGKEEAAILSAIIKTCNSSAWTWYERALRVQFNPPFPAPPVGQHKSLILACKCRKHTINCVSAMFCVREAGARPCDGLPALCPEPGKTGLGSPLWGLGGKGEGRGKADQSGGRAGPWVWWGGRGGARFWHLNWILISIPGLPYTGHSDLRQWLGSTRGKVTPPFSKLRHSCLPTGAAYGAGQPTLIRTGMPICFRYMYYLLPQRDFK